MKRNDTHDTRRLHVNDQHWEYKIGIKHVAIYDNQNNRYYPTIEQIVGEEDFKHKKYQLNPAVIKAYIYNHICQPKEKNQPRLVKKYIKSNDNMKVVTYHITLVPITARLDYMTYSFQMEEKTETTSIHKYEAFLEKLEQLSGHERHKIIIINSLKFE